MRSRAQFLTQPPPAPPMFGQNTAEHPYYASSCHSLEPLVLVSMRRHSHGGREPDGERNAESEACAGGGPPRAVPGPRCMRKRLRLDDEHLPAAVRPSQTQVSVLKERGLAFMHPDVPVDHLPPEILTIIFSILSSIDPPRSNAKRKYKLGWVTVTHVCQRWRNIALRNPLLWASNIALPSQLGDLWAATFLTRSQTMPLTVTSGGPTVPFSDTSFIGENLARICAITVQLTTSSFLLLALCTPAPLLHTLNIKTDGDIHPLQLALFGGAAGLPELRHLSVLTWKAEPWIPLLVEQLVSVDMNIHTAVTHAHFANILAALGRMPALERLALDMYPADTDGVPVTLLPSLRHLTLGQFSRDVLSILPHLALPAGVRVICDISANTMDSNVEKKLRIPTVSPAMIACAHATAISRVNVKLTVADRSLYASDLYVEVGVWRSGDTDGGPALVVRFAGWGHAPRVLESLPSTHLEAVYAEGDTPDASWIEAVGRAPKLHHVTVKGGAVSPFCDALERVVGILPALATLVINIQGHPYVETVLRDMLPRCLAARGRAGDFLEELEVVGYGEDEACVRVLREAMPGLVIRWRWEVEAEDEDNSDSDSSEGVSDFSALEDEI
ncbi:hypothetical protein FA95DRAFT_1600159 [Auriscalpium vulgare]|uniref:Uncharacterized protein n=1 Tax=Auriscalpium vulgare TaxID=40419 RepID=A0ACB8R317_9AGAM|nr:hypothetical protein FA95DRAFT_1600159 [Auriscalpium vulgare]